MWLFSARSSSGKPTEQAARSRSNCSEENVSSSLGNKGIYKKKDFSATESFAGNSRGSYIRPHKDDRPTLFLLPAVFSHPSFSAYFSYCLKPLSVTQRKKILSAAQQVFVRCEQSQLRAGIFSPFFYITEHQVRPCRIYYTL